MHVISLATCFKQNARNTFHKKIVYFFWSETYPIVKDSMAIKNSTVNIQTDPVALSTMSVKSSEYPKLIFNRHSQSIAVMYMSVIYILKIYCIETFDT